MQDFVLSIKPAVEGYGTHDPSAAIFQDGKLEYGIEEERLSRQKHASGTFPTQSINACLEYCNLKLSELTKIVLAYNPQLEVKNIRYELGQAVHTGSIAATLYNLNELAVETAVHQFYPRESVKRALNRSFDDNLPPLETRSHHKCHAASAFHPSGFDEALVVTIDGKGEYDSTVIWHGTESGLNRIKTNEFPNSLGHFFAAVTEFLGYRAFNGEGKIMGLAPYGARNNSIEETLRNTAKFGADYDVTKITEGGIESGVNTLERLFARKRKQTSSEFSDWEKDFAYVAQQLLEESVVEIVRRYCRKIGTENVGLAGGVALNCKMNKRVMELDTVEELFIQPVAHDGGLAVGAGFLEYDPTDIPKMETVYCGPEYSSEKITNLLETNKLEYEIPENLEKAVAEGLADGKLVGWFQGRLEMGPRALGNRSILADPRTKDSRDRVNKYVKHRETWRPFAPSMLLEAANDYLKKPESSPHMIKTFGTNTEKRDQIQAVLHPGDDTTRPQTVTQKQNPQYYRLIREFEKITDVPVLLNTSFNDHGEPIVTTPSEAIKDFYGMGLDILVLGKCMIRK